MASIENLEIIVEVDISSAIAALEDLQDELREVSQQISQVDARGAEGIDIDTDVESIADDLALARSQIEGFEQTTSVDIPMNVHDRGLAEILGRAGMSSLDELTGTFQDDMLADFAQSAPMDFGGFNVPRGRGIGGDEQSQLARRIRNLASSVSDVLGEMTDFRLRMSDMHNAMATMIPLLLVFIGTIPTVVAAFATLATAAITAAGALLAIGGLGLLGAAADGGGRPSAEDIQAELTEIVDSFWSAFAPLANQLAPTFERGLDGLERFFEAIAAEGDALMALTDDVSAFGRFLIDFIPGALRTLAATLEATTALFGEMGSFLSDNFRPVMRDLIRITVEAAPALAELAVRLGQVAMFLAELGVGFARVANLTIRLFGALGGLTRMFGITNEQLGLLVGSLLAFATLLGLANTRLVQFALRGLASAIVGIWNFWAGLLAANNRLAFLAGTTVGSAITSLYSLVTAAFSGSTSLWTLAASALSATGAVAALMTVLTLGAGIALAGIALSIASNFFTMADGINSATSSLQDFNNVAGKTSGPSFNPYDGDDPAGGSGSVRGRGGGTTINYESTGNNNQDQSNLDKTAWRANRTTGDT